MSKVLNKIKRRGNTHLITRFIRELHDYYNSGYGSIEVAVDLKIFITNGYFYRHEICRWSLVYIV